MREPDLPRLSGDWQTAELPPGYDYLVFRAYGDVRIDVAGRRVYELPSPEGTLSVHVVPVPRAGGRLDVGTPGDALGDDALLATQATLPAAVRDVTLGPLRGDTVDILLALLFIVTGVIALVAAGLRRRGNATGLAAMGTFTLLYGTRLVFESYLPVLLGAPVPAVAYTAAWLTYVIPIPGWIAARWLLGDGWRSSLRLQVYAFSLLPPIGIITDLVTRTPGALEQVNNVLVIAAGLNILFNVFRTREQRTSELRIIMAGSVVFMLFALENNLSALGLLPFRGSFESIGLLAFIGSLGYASTRAFIRGEREQLALEHELHTAREIQQSILPHAMPAVPGLEFDSAYDPATSVAGDLYDFIRVDEQHAGVLVADVAGHGVPAALIASMVKIAASSQARLADDPAALVAALNATLRNEVRRAFVTATYLWFDMEHGCVSVCNAGHAPPLLYRDGTFVELGTHGVLLGRFADARYQSRTVALQPGDRVVAFTDGIVEARNGREEQFGEERLKELIARGSASEAVAAVHQWRVEEDADDLTIIVVDVTRRTRGPART
ncbi:MAG TPA: PP2C family protein-serine/threonine phosphatase [Thermoanaerobaculia bacterium]